MIPKLLPIALLMLCSAAPVAAEATIGEKLDRFVDTAIEAYGVVPGFALCVVRGREIIHLKGYGLREVEQGLPVTPDTGFYIASATKSFTGMAGSVLAAEGRIELDAPISRYLPELSLPAPLSADDITLIAALTHRTGVKNNPVQRQLAFVSALDMREFLELMQRESSPMRSDFVYSNLGYNLFGYLIEELTGTPWQRVVREQVLQPVGMSDTTTSIETAARGDFAFPYTLKGDAWQQERYKDDSTMHAAGGIVSTAADLARWLIVNLNEGEIDGRVALAAEAVSEAHRAHATTDRDYDRFHRTGYGLGWYHSDFEGELLIHHFGGIDGYHAHVSFMPEHDMGVAALMNTDAYDTSSLAHLVAAYAYETLLGRPDVEGRYDSELADRSARSRGKKRFEDRMAESMHLLANDQEEAGTRLILAALGDARSESIIDARAINGLGYTLIGQEHFGAAIAVFEFNVEANPEVPNAYDSLGEAYERAGKLEMAGANYAKALALAEAQGDDNLELFRSNLERVTEVNR
ncbi:MAG: serine hydrolase [bacterium]|nr:serine hydrolase [bacterium]